jgi:hypothetical protein
LITNIAFVINYKNFLPNIENMARKFRFGGKVVEKSVQLSSIEDCGILLGATSRGFGKNGRIGIFSQI